MKLVFFRIRAVEGRMIVNPFTLGAPQRAIVGYKQRLDGEITDVFSGKPRPKLSHMLEKDDCEEIVPETTDHYFRKAIQGGDLDYVSTIHREKKNGKDEEFEFRDSELVLYTAKHKQLRAQAVEDAAAAEKREAAREEMALKAADAGKTVSEYLADELRAKKKAKTDGKPE